MTVKVIPKLSHSLNLTETKCVPYEDEISKDWVCTKLQEKNNIGENSVMLVRKYRGPDFDTPNFYTQTHFHIKILKMFHIE